MTLLELTEPLFQYICMLNRIARNPGGENMSLEALRPVIVDMMTGMKAQVEEENEDGAGAEEEEAEDVPTTKRGARSQASKGKPAPKVRLLSDLVCFLALEMSPYAQAPAAKTVQYTLIGTQVVLVDPTNMRVVDIISQ